MASTEKQKEYARRYYQNHKEEIKARNMSRKGYHQDYYQRNKERVKLYRDEHQQDHTEYMKKYRAEHRDEYNRYMREYMKRRKQQKKIDQLKEEYSGKEFTKEERKAEIERLSSEGYTFREIGEILGLTTSRACYIHNHEYKRNENHMPQWDYLEVTGMTFQFNKGDKYCYDEAFDCKHWKKGRCTKCESTIFTDVCGQRIPCEEYEAAR